MVGRHIPGLYLSLGYGWEAYTRVLLLLGYGREAYTRCIPLREARRVAYIPIDGALGSPLDPFHCWSITRLLALRTLSGPPHS